MTRRLLLIACLAVGPAAAAEPDDRLRLKKVQTYVDLGAELFQAGDFGGALAEFRRAEGLVEDPRHAAALRYNIARCLEELGRHAEAVAAFERYLEAPDDAQTRRKAEEKLRALTGRVFGGLEVTCEPDDARVQLAGHDPTPRACPAAWKRLAPGAYAVTVDAGAGPGETTVDIVAGRTTSLALRAPGTLRVTGPPSLAVRLGDRALGRPPLELAGLPPGPYTLTVTAAGGEQRTVAAVVAPGSVQAVALEAEATAPAGLDRIEPYLRWGAAAGAAAAIIAGGWYLASAADDIDRFEGHLRDYDRATDGDAAVTARRAAMAAEDDARVHRAFGGVFLGVGLGLAGAATWLFLRDGGDLAVAPAPGGLVIGGGW